MIVINVAFTILFISLQTVHTTVTLYLAYTGSGSCWKVEEDRRRSWGVYAGAARGPLSCTQYTHGLAASQCRRVGHTAFLLHLEHARNGAPRRMRQQHWALRQGDDCEQNPVTLNPVTRWPGIPTYVISHQGRPYSFAYMHRLVTPCLPGAGGHT